MGGFNSGRSGGKVKCESCLWIDVLTWARKGLLKPGVQFSVNWSNGSNIAVSVRMERVELKYAYNGGTSGIHPLHLDYTSCNYGGRRVWFLCPCCASRNTKLYLLNGRFSCRTCQRLRYHSQALDPLGRNQLAYSRIQRKMVDGVFKPKGMHWQTAERLYERMEMIDERINLTFTQSAMRFFKRFGKL